MTTMRVSLPSKDLVISWSHPWIHCKKQGVENVFTKISQCFIAEYKGERPNAAGKMKPVVRFMVQAVLKWPLYSWDGTKGHTYNTNGDQVSKKRGRKLSLKMALSQLGLSTAERTIIWHAYLRRFEPGVPIPPALPVEMFATTFGQGVVDKIMPARVIDFPGRIQDPARLLALIPDSKIVH